MNLHNKEHGQSLVEYSLVLALVSTAVIGAVGQLGNSVSDTLGNINQQLDTSSSRAAGETSGSTCRVTTGSCGGGDGGANGDNGGDNGGNSKGRTKMN